MQMLIIKNLRGYKVETSTETKLTKKGAFLRRGDKHEMSFVKSDFATRPRMAELQRKRMFSKGCLF